MRLKNKIVLVTGASTGLGEQICYEAAKQGAIVIACARRYTLIQQVQEKCSRLSQQPAFAFEVDVANPDSIEHLIKQVKTEIGTVDILVNNAGFGYFEDFVTFDMATTRQMFEVNVLGMMLLTQRLAIGMLEQQSGHIINIASIAGKVATPKTAVYSATKFAVLGFSNALRLELKPFNIHVTTVNPGPIQTEFFDKADPKGDYLSNVQAFVLQPQKLAEEIVSQMLRPKREINRPIVMEVAAKFYQLFPHIGDYLAGGLFNKK